MMAKGILPLTLVESISLAGDRAKQNDDAFGFADGRAWVIDGATDLHDAPLTHRASDAGWLAHYANERLYAAAPNDTLRDSVRMASVWAAQAFAAASGNRAHERWQSPLASLLIIESAAERIEGLDLGDCRIFALDANGAVHVAGGAEGGRDAEVRAAAQQTDADKPLLQRTSTLDKLRRNRATLNQPGAQWTFCIDPACADHARLWSFALARPAHVLLMTDGFAALADQYGAYDAAGLVRAARDKGLQELGRELRVIETADAGGAQHPRFKRSDDATALLLRLQ
jgi:hypothetical protein